MLRSTQEDEAVFFHDVSTRRGRVHRMLFRWKCMFLPLLVFSAFLLTLGLITGSASSSDALQLQEAGIFPQIKLNKSKLEIHGDPSKPTISVEKTTDFFQNFDPFPGIQNSITSLSTKFGPGPLLNPKTIKTLEIKWYKIHGPNFTAELSLLFPNLEVLHLDNVTIFDELQPTPMPKLRELYVNQMIAEGQPKHEFAFYVDGYSSYLSSNFFFLNDVTNSTDFNTNLAQTKVNISIWLDGSIVFSVDGQKKEIRSSLANCRSLLENSTTPYEIVTLGICNNDLLPTSISPRTKILNLYQTSAITTDFLSDLFPILPNLEQLFIEVTATEVAINMDELPKSLKLFSASSTRLSGSQDLVLPSVKEFYFGGENQYGWVEVKDTELPNDFLLRNFHQVFPHIDKVGIFELRRGQYTFLKSVLNSTATLIVVQGFPRVGNDSSSPFQDQNQAEIEALLTDLGIPSTANFFVITRGKDGKRLGRGLNWDEQQAFRYTMLGWDRVDSWDKYVHVRKLIDSGFVLGLKISNRF